MHINNTYLNKCHKKTTSIHNIKSFLYINTNSLFILSQISAKVYQQNWMHLIENLDKKHQLSFKIFFLIFDTKGIT